MQDQDMAPNASICRASVLPMQDQDIKPSSLLALCLFVGSLSQALLHALLRVAPSSFLSWLSTGTSGLIHIFMSHSLEAVRTDSGVKMKPERDLSWARWLTNRGRSSISSSSGEGSILVSGSALSETVDWLSEPYDQSSDDQTIGWYESGRTSISSGTNSQRRRSPSWSNGRRLMYINEIHSKILAKGNYLFWKTSRNCITIHTEPSR